MKLLYSLDTTTAVATPSSWWRARSDEQRRTYLKKHPRSKYGVNSKQAGLEKPKPVVKKNPQPAAPAKKAAPPKTPLQAPKSNKGKAQRVEKEANKRGTIANPPAIKRTFSSGLTPKIRKDTAENVAKNWHASDAVTEVSDKLKHPEKWKPSKVHTAAKAIRDAIATNSDARKFVTSAATILTLAGVGLVLGGASLALGGDTSIFLPMLIQGVWSGLETHHDDLKLVTSFTDAVREKLKNPTPEEIENSLHQQKK